MSNNRIVKYALGMIGIVGVALLWFGAPVQAGPVYFINHWPIIDEELKARPESAIDVHGGTFSAAGWQQKSREDYIDFDTRTLCRGNIDFDITGIDVNSIIAEERGTKDFGSLVSMYDDAETGMSQDPAFFQGACFDSTLSIGGSEDKETAPSGKSCTDIAQGRTLIRTEGTNVCVFDSSAYLKNDLILRHNQGKDVDYRSSKQSDGASYDLGNKQANDSAGKEPSWEKNKKYHVSLSWETGISQMKITRCSEPKLNNINILNYKNTDPDSPCYLSGEQLDTFITENKKGEFRPGMGRLRLGNSATLLASGLREGGHGIPGAIYSNLKVKGRRCQPDYSGCPTYENASCADLSRQEDIDLFSGFNPDKPPDPFSTSVKSSFGVPTGIKVRLRLDSWVAGFKDVSPDPELSLSVLPQSPKPTEKVTALAANLNFNNDNGTPTYTNWCVDNVFQGGIGAGGEWTTETTDDGSTPLAGPCCRPVTRTPTKDEDQDGMDDDWEKRYFPGLDIKDVKPDEDADSNPDGDGCVIDKPRNAKGEYLVLAPKVISSLKKEYILGTGSKDNKGVFPNILEYIFGTDPTDPDTDADGVDDECDVLGKNQNELEFKPANKGFGETATIRATTLGQSAKYLTKIESTEQKIYLTAGGNLDITMTKSPANPKPGDTITVTASVSKGLTGVENLDFQWKMRKPVRDASGKITGAETVDLCAGQSAAMCGIGKNQITVKLPGGNELKPTEYVTMSVTVSEKSTNRRTKKEFQITAQGGASFDWGVAKSTETSCEQSDLSDKIPAQGQHVAFKGALGGDAGLAPAGQTVYLWSVDGIRIRDSRANGELLCLKAEKFPGQSYQVALTVVDDIGTRYEAGVKTITVGSPKIVLSADPANPAPGQEVTVTATPENFPDDASVSYKWVIDDEQSTLTGSKLQFKAGQKDQTHKIYVSGSATGGAQASAYRQADESLPIKVSGSRASSSIQQSQAFIGKMWDVMKGLIGKK